MDSRKKHCCKCMAEMNFSDEADEEMGGSVEEPESSQSPLLPEILNMILTHLEPKDLKPCRLVNKSWNAEACRFLQRLTCVHIRNDTDTEDAREKIMSLISTLEQVEKDNRPCPFDKMQLTASDLDSELMELLMCATIRKKLSLVHFRLNPPRNHEETGRELALNMYNLLSENGTTLKFFDCTLTASMSFLGWDDVKDKPPLSLPALTGISFDDTDVPSFRSKWKDFLVHVIQGAPNLTVLNVITFDDQVFNDIMKNADLSNLEEIFIQDFTPRHFPLFLTLKLPKLRTLHLDIVHIAEENMMTSDDLKAIVSNFAPTLQELSVNWATSSNIEGPFPYCPRLRQLTVDNWPGSLGLFNSKELPSLESLTVYEEIEGNVDIAMITDPHEGVINLRWEGNPRADNDSADSNNNNGGRRFNTELEEKRVYTIAYLSIQFPNLRYLDLTCAASDDMIRTIVTHLPRLEIFELMTECTLSESIFTGINRYTLLHFLDAGVSIEKCVRSTSLTDMQHLKKLTLHSYGSRGFPLTNNALIFGISEMPALEFLHIDWTEDLDPEVILRNLNHLTSLVIKHADKSAVNTQILLAMTNKMPQIKFDPELCSNEP